MCGFGAAFFLSLTLKHLPVGLTYAMWTGIAVVGSNLVAMTFHHESFGLFRMLCILLIACGVVGLRLSA
jgi:quaternary ammonium compound-resistance protein SugE